MDLISDQTDCEGRTEADIDVGKGLGWVAGAAGKAASSEET